MLISEEATTLLNNYNKWSRKLAIAERDSSSVLEIEPKYWRAKAELEEYIFWLEENIRSTMY